MFLNTLTELELREVRIREPNVVDLPSHVIEAVDGMEKRSCHVSHMNEVTLEVALEQHDETIGVRAVGEVVHEKIQAHARRHAKYRGKSEADRRWMPLEQSLLDLDLVADRKST